MRFGTRLCSDDAQTAVRTLPFVKGLAEVGPGLTASNAAHQPVEGSRVIERVREFNPGRSREKCGQAPTLRPLGAREENGNHAKTPAAILDAPIKAFAFQGLTQTIVPAPRILTTRCYLLAISTDFTLHGS
jgi:hypothetical protein